MSREEEISGQMCLGLGQEVSQRIFPSTDASDTFGSDQEHQREMRSGRSQGKLLSMKFIYY